MSSKANYRPIAYWLIIGAILIQLAQLPIVLAAEASNDLGSGIDSMQRQGNMENEFSSGKREPELEFLEKRRAVSEFLGKRRPVSEYLGKRQPPVTEYLGKRRPVSEFLGKRRPVSEYLGKRRPVSEYLGKRRPVSEYLGKRRPVSEYLGKRRPVSEYLGKRRPVSEYLGKRRPVSDALRAAARLKQNGDRTVKYEFLATNFDNKTKNFSYDFGAKFRNEKEQNEPKMKNVLPPPPLPPPLPSSPRRQSRVSSSIRKRRGRGGLLVQPAVAQVLLSGGRGVPALLADVQLLPALLVRVGEHPAVHLLAVRLQRAALGEGFAAVRAFVGPNACGRRGSGGALGMLLGIRRTRKSARKYSKAPHGHPQVRISMPLICCYKKRQKQQPAELRNRGPPLPRSKVSLKPLPQYLQRKRFRVEWHFRWRFSSRCRENCLPHSRHWKAFSPTWEPAEKYSNLPFFELCAAQHAVLPASLSQRIPDPVAVINKLYGRKFRQRSRLRGLRKRRRLRRRRRRRRRRRWRHKGKLRPPADAAEAAKPGAEAAGVAQEMPKAAEAARETMKAAVAAAEAGLAMHPQSQPLSSRLARCRSSTDSPRMRLMPNFSCEASVAAPACCLWRCGAGSCCGVAPSRQEPLRSTGESRSLPVAMAESPLRPPPRAASRTVEWPAERRISCEISWEISWEISSGVLAREPENGELEIACLEALTAAGEEQNSNKLKIGWALLWRVTLL
uniref:Uncharacterized protein n=1 Tax=Macrostomum lignano TaxID=282301 RepID=A0A1I8IPR6_9PLAT